MATIEVTHPARRSLATTQPERSLQRAGGIAALLEGAALIVSGVLILGVVPVIGMKEGYWEDPSRAVPILAAHQGFFVSAALFVALAALMVIPVVMALHERLRAFSPGPISAATILGIIGVTMGALNQLGVSAEARIAAQTSRSFAQAAMPGWLIAYDGTSAGAGLGLGLWTLTISWVVMRKGGLPRWLAYLGILVGLANLVTLVGPPVGEVLSIPWFISVGITLLRAPAVEGSAL